MVYCVQCSNSLAIVRRFNLSDFIRNLPRSMKISSYLLQFRSALFIFKIIHSYFLTLCITVLYCLARIRPWTTIWNLRNNASRKRASKPLVEHYIISTNESLICLIKRNEKKLGKCASHSNSDTKTVFYEQEQEHKWYFMVAACILPYSIYSGKVYNDRVFLFCLVWNTPSFDRFISFGAFHLITSNGGVNKVLILSLATNNKLNGVYGKSIADDCVNWIVGVLFCNLGLNIHHCVRPNR